MPSSLVVNEGELLHSLGSVAQNTANLIDP